MERERDKLLKQNIEFEWVDAQSNFAQSICKITVIIHWSWNTQTSRYPNLKIVLFGTGLWFSSAGRQRSNILNTYAFQLQQIVRFIGKNPAMNRALCCYGYCYSHMLLSNTTAELIFAVKQEKKTVLFLFLSFFCVSIFDHVDTNEVAPNRHVRIVLIHLSQTFVCIISQPIRRWHSQYVYLIWTVYV